MKFPKLDISSWILIGLSIGLLVYTGMRASMLSMTHDESSTYLNYINQALWECFYLPVCWGTANLHLINTLLMQITVGLFGADEFFVRMPNLIGHLIYLISSGLLVRSISSNHWLRIACFLLLNTNPYLLEFFSLGRGYGLACAFMMMSLYYLYKFLTNKQANALIWCYIGAILAILSNFTFLNYWAALTAVIGLMVIQAYLQKEFIPALSLNSPKPEGASMSAITPTRMLLISVSSAVLLLLFLYFPISYLRQLGEFEYGSNTLAETYTRLLNDSIQTEGYFGKNTLPTFRIIGLAFALPALLTGLIAGRKKETALQQYLFSSSVLVLIFFLAIITQRYLLGTKYLVDRKAVIFIPLMGIPVVMTLQYWGRRYTKVMTGFAIVLTGFLVLHMSRTFNLTQCQEWYYDAYTRDMLEYVSTRVKPGERVKLGGYWLFTHSSNFYIESQNLDFVGPMRYEKKVRTDRLYDYYYVEPSHGDIIHPDYVLEKRFGWVARLYRRKDVVPYDGVAQSL
ncbi:MAG: hypothetical protein AAF587_02600 [Bacteroidota bacterium]